MYPRPLILKLPLSKILILFPSSIFKVGAFSVILISPFVTFIFPSEAKLKYAVPELNSCVIFKEALFASILPPIYIPPDADVKPLAVDCIFMKAFSLLSTLSSFNVPNNAK